MSRHRKDPGAGFIRFCKTIIIFGVAMFAFGPIFSAHAAVSVWTANASIHDLGLFSDVRVSKAANELRAAIAEQSALNDLEPITSFTKTPLGFKELEGWRRPNGVEVTATYLGQIDGEDAYRIVASKGSTVAVLDTNKSRIAVVKD